MGIFIVVAVLIILSYIIYISLSHVLLDKAFFPIGPDTIPLSTVKQVITSEELNKLWSNVSGSTLIFHINPRINDRTAQSGNEYANVIKIGSKLFFQVLIAPDAGRGELKAPAQLTILTGSPLNTLTEKVDIPNFPLQRWTSVAIVKDGRRFNIYLNGRLSVSYTCKKMPQYDTTQPLIVGDSRLGGSITSMSITPNPLQSNEIRDLVSGAVDTSGAPYGPVTFWTICSNFIPDLSPFNNLWKYLWCPGGNCNMPVSTGPMKTWSSSYA